MKKIVCLLLLAGGAFGIGGCATPAYTGGENLARTFRTWDYEYKQMNEDINHVFLFQPPSQSSIWNLK